MLEGLRPPSPLPSPPQTSTPLLSYPFPTPADQLAFDASAPGVRVAVLEGLRLLVDNVHAQPVLKRALPQLAPLMHDAAPAVRVAMADLLLCISTSRGLKFWEVRAGKMGLGGDGVAEEKPPLMIDWLLPGSGGCLALFWVRLVY